MELLTKSIIYKKNTSFDSFQHFMIKYADRIEYALQEGKITVIIEENTENETPFINKLRIEDQ